MEKSASASRNGCGGREKAILSSSRGKKVKRENPGDSQEKGRKGEGAPTGAIKKGGRKGGKKNRAEGRKRELGKVIVHQACGVEKREEIVTPTILFTGKGKKKKDSKTRGRKEYRYSLWTHLPDEEGKEEGEKV